jgi:hypothetical protein
MQRVSSARTGPFFQRKREEYWQSHRLLRNTEKILPLSAEDGYI